jgi:hypothetical protein
MTEQTTFTQAEKDDLDWPDPPEPENTQEAWAAEKIIRQHIIGGLFTLPSLRGGRAYRELLCGCGSAFCGPVGIDDDKLIACWVNHLAVELDWAGALRELGEDEEEYQ